MHFFCIRKWTWGKAGTFNGQSYEKPTKNRCNPLLSQSDDRQYHPLYLYADHAADTGSGRIWLYGIANSAMSYVGLLNFGIGGTIVRYLSKYRAAGDAKSRGTDSRTFH